MGVPAIHVVMFMNSISLYCACNIIVRSTSDEQPCIVQIHSMDDADILHLKYNWKGK